MSAIPIHLREIHFHVLPMQTRFPFKYGIASMTQLPHLFVSSTVEVAGRSSHGLATEGLPPKWFTKYPDTTFEQDLKSDLEVIRTAAKVATETGRCQHFFEFWDRFYTEFKKQWLPSGVPPLLANFALSLVERSVLDALAKALGRPLHQLLRDEGLGIRLSVIHPELKGITPDNFLPEKPLEHTIVRHTVGLGDPLTPEETGSGNEPDDGLPMDLVSSIRRYGLSYFKIKLSGDMNRDQPRLKAIAEILRQELAGGFFITLDGNEQFRDFEAFRECWDSLQRTPVIRSMLTKNLLLVEQPVHRDQALDPANTEQLKDWSGHPDFIIDEADGDLDSLPKAMEIGYAGTSHKNCKGIVKGLANAALLYFRSSTAGSKTVLSGEDLANVGPVALLQDLAMMNALGIRHVERNGHHYFKGLSAFPADIRQNVLDAHGDLYHLSSQGWPTLHISKGRICTSSVNQAPFGCAVVVETSHFEDLDSWAASNLD